MTFTSSSSVIFVEVGEHPPCSKIYKWDGFFSPCCSNYSKWHKWSMFLIINTPLAANSEYSAAVSLEIIVQLPCIYSSADLKRFFWFDTNRVRKKRANCASSLSADCTEMKGLEKQTHYFAVTVALSLRMECVIALCAALQLEKETAISCCSCWLLLLR